MNEDQQQQLAPSLEDVARQALDFAGDMMQQLGWARQQGDDLHRELDRDEANAYRLFNACWDALGMGPPERCGCLVTDAGHNPYPGRPVTMPRSEERFAPVTKSAPLDAYQDERRLACDLGLCEQHGSRTPREHLVVPNGNTDTEKRAEDTECDRSVTPSREPLLAARDEARRAALDAYKDATPEQMVAMLAGVSVEDVRRLGGVPDGRFAHITDQDEIRQIVGDIPESSGFQKSETDLDHE